MKRKRNVIIAGSASGLKAALVLKDQGWNNVKTMEGGIMAWPFPRGK